MNGKIATVAALMVVALAAGVHGASSYHHQHVPLEKESRIVEVPTLGGLILKGAKVGLFLIKKAWSIVGLKLGAIALVANLVIWGLKHSFSIILGSIGMFGFCKITGKCSFNHIPKPVLEIGDTLLYAARQLQNGADLYEANDILY